MKYIKMLIPLLFIYMLVGCKYEVIKYELEDKTVVYNNEEHTLVYEKELNDTTVVYENNVHKETGVYEVVAIFTYKDTSYESKATLTILPKEIEISDFSYIDTILYNGLHNEIELINLPNNITYTFEENNSYKDIGVYNNTIIFNSTNNNYLNTELDITFTILSNEEIDTLFNSSFEEKEFTYNKQFQSIYLTNEEELLSYGYEIEYINNTNINAGSYEVKAIISKESIIHEVTTNIVINKKQLTVNFIGDTTYYEDEEINIVIDKDIEVEYLYYKDNILIDKPTKEGTYIIEAIFKDNNYLIDTISTSFNIILDHSILDNTLFNNKEVIYNYNTNSIYLSNEEELINKGYNIEYINNNHINIGEYNVVAIVTKSSFIKEYTALLTIIPLEISPNINNLIFNENNVNIEIDYNIEYSKVYYDLNNNIIDKPSEVGLYKVEVLFNNDNYIVDNIEEYFIVILNEEHINLINNSYFNNITFNNDIQTVYLNNHNELIENEFNIEYENNSLLFSGTYEIKVIITKGNYYKELLLEITVNKLEVTPSFIEINNIIEGSSYHFYIKEEIDTDITYTYYKDNIEINKPSTYGSYKVIATFYNYSNNIIINDIELEYNIYFNSYTQSLIDNTYLEDKEVTFNNEKHYIYLNNHKDLILERFSVTYLYNNKIELPIEVGVYNVFVTISKNDTIIKQLNATLIINPS